MNQIILSLKSKRKEYLSKTSVPIIIALGIYATAAVFLWAYFQNASHGQNEISVLIVAVAIAFIGDIFMNKGTGNYAKAKKSEKTFLNIGTERTEGNINGKDFSIPNESIISVSVDTFSTKVDENGVPVKLEVNGMMKFKARTNEYLSIYVDGGKTYYIDCIEAPEKAKSTIESLITAARLKQNQ